MPNYPEIEVVDMHTGGEPLRIITSGYPEIKGTTILEKRRFAREHLDHLRKFLMFEPRGHKEMYGAILVEPTLPEADLAVLFIHNEGYSTMCGHAVIALGRYAIDQGMVKKEQSKSQVNIECPCGLVKVEVDTDTLESSFVSVPSFLLHENKVIELEDGKTVTVDISYGGAFYALVEDRELSVDIDTTPVQKMTEAADDLTQCVKQQVNITHPESEDLSFLYGSIITDGKLPERKSTKNMCVFADAQVDRSPTGSGVTARMAMAYAKGIIVMGEKVEFESVVGSRFVAEVVEESRLGDMLAVRVKVTGKGYYTAKSTFFYDEGDELGKGFLCK